MGSNKNANAKQGQKGQQQQQNSNGSKNSKNKSGKKNGSTSKDRSKKSSRSCAGFLVSLFVQLIALTSLLAALSIVGFVGHRYYVAGRPPTVDEFVKAATDGATVVATNAKQGWLTTQTYTKKYYAQFERDHLPVIKAYTGHAYDWTRDKSAKGVELAKQYYAIGSAKAVEYYGVARQQVMTWYAQMQGGKEASKKPSPSEKSKQQQQQSRGKA